MIKESEIKSTYQGGYKIWNSYGIMHKNYYLKLAAYFEQIKKELTLNKDCFYRLPGQAEYFYMRNSPWIINLQMKYEQISLIWMIKEEEAKQRFGKAGPITISSGTLSYVQYVRGEKYLSVHMPFNDIFEVMTPEEKKLVVFNMNIFQ